MWYPQLWSDSACKTTTTFGVRLRAEGGSMRCHVGPKGYIFRATPFSFDAAKGIFFLIDHASTNGVFLNGTRIAPEAATPVRGGDVVVFGGGGRCKVGRRLPQPRSAYRYTVVVKAADLIEERNIPQQNRVGFGGENCNAGNVGSPSRRFSGSQIEAPGAAQQRLIARLQADLAAKAAEAAELQEKVRAETEAAVALRADLVAKAAEAAELQKKVKAEAEAQRRSRRIWWPRRPRRTHRKRSRLMLPKRCATYRPFKGKNQPLGVCLGGRLGGRRCS